MSNVSKEERGGKAAGGAVAVSGRSSTRNYADRWLSALERWLNYLGMVVLIGLMAMVVFEVVARYIFRSPIQGYIDIMEMMMAVLVFLTLAYCQHTGGHIRMEMFMTRVLVGGRRYQVFEFFHLLVSLVAFGLIAFFSAKTALEGYFTGDVTMTIHLATWPVRMLTAIGSIVLCLRFIMQMFQPLAGSGVKGGGL